ncbi:MAG: hypothetical protein ACRYFZ_24425 [Janthinobacterium lividum]
MQKIAIIGPGSIGIAASMTLLASQYEVIGLADSSVCMDFATPGGSLEYRPMPMSISFDFDYNPSPKEEAWLLEQMRLGEQSEIVGIKPAPLLEDGLVCSASYWYESGKGAAWRAQQPRHRSLFTKSQPSAKARKLARRRAKAGRKASR